MLDVGYLELLCCCSVAKSSLIPCDPMNCRTPGFPVIHYFSELAQTQIHWIDDAIQPSHPLSSPSPPTFSLSQHQGLFQWVSSSHQVAKGLELMYGLPIEKSTETEECWELWGPAAVSVVRTTSVMCKGHQSSFLASQAFSCCSEWGPLFTAVSGLLIAVCRLQWLQCVGSVVVALGLSCSKACGIFQDQGSNVCLLRWQADS